VVDKKSLAVATSEETDGNPLLWMMARGVSSDADVLASDVLVLAALAALED